MPEVAFLPAAAADYEEILAWYQARSPQAAAGFEAAVEVALRQIQISPQRWAMCDDRHYFYVLKRYPISLIYRFEADVLVVAVAHSSRSKRFWSGR